MLNTMSWIIVGLVLGGLIWLASGRHPIGLCLSGVLGAAGALASGMIAWAIWDVPGWGQPPFDWRGLMIAVLGGGLTLLYSHLVWPQPAEKPAPQKLPALPPLPAQGIPINGRYIGWLRIHWSHWEPVAWGNEAEEVWAELRAIQTLDEDGERVVLPYGEPPVDLYLPDSPLG